MIKSQQSQQPPRTALAAFIGESSGGSGSGSSSATTSRKRAKKNATEEDAPAAAGAAAERNEFLESLFTVCVESEPLLGDMPATTTTTTTMMTSTNLPTVAGGSGGLAFAQTLPPPPAFSLAGGGADNSSLTRAARTNYTASNPHFDTERLLVPYTGPVLHNGSEVLPGERIIQVARYGRIYKRKSPMSTILRNKTNAPHGTRYCKICHAFQPEEAFYTHIRRYVCKRHHAERVDKYRHSHDVTEQVAISMWFSLKEQANMLGYLNLNYDAQDIRSLMIHAGIPFSMKVDIIPIDPSIPLRPRNVAIVSQQTFRLICKGYEQMCSRALFIAQVQRCNLLPAQMDVGWPENPWHDPHYRRQDIDVGPLLLAELQGPLDCADRTVLETLIEDEPKTPWIKHAASSLPLCIAMRDRMEKNVEKKEMRTKQQKKKKSQARMSLAEALDENEEEEVVDEATARERRRQADAAAVAAAAVAPRQRCTPHRIKL